MYILGLEQVWSGISDQWHAEKESSPRKVGKVGMMEETSCGVFFLLKAEIAWLEVRSTALSGSCSQNIITMDSRNYP